MYGVPADLPLGKFIGQEINQIAIGRYQIQFNVSGSGSICVEGPVKGARSWELRDRSDILIDSARVHEERDFYRIHQIIDIKIANFLIDPPRSFTLVFESGHKLEIFDESDQYESFSIWFDGKTYCFI
jgi:hypothetical protein